MSQHPPDYIGFDRYTSHVPRGIAAAVQNATRRFATNRKARIAEMPHWEDLRRCGSDIRLHTLRHLDYYLEKGAARVTEAGGHVHWALDAAEARQIVLRIAQDHRVTRVVKAKSMATEEIGLNEALLAAGIDTMETDLGEYIIQLAGTGPSHIIVPAVHLRKEEIAALFSEKLQIHAPPDPNALTAIARNVLREKFLQADMGISGANFFVAETGTLVVVSNEGNARMCTTIPDLHVAVVGIDKVVPDWESLTVLLKLLPRSATGQKITAYTSFITGPRRQEGENGPRELHLVLLDNGRSKVLQDPVGGEMFKCIRCGSCLNTCPVYQNVGGFAYGWFISGPIGAIFSSQMLGAKAARELPYASTLCGACADVCPVRVPIPDILRHLRHRMAEGDAVGGPTLPQPVRLVARLTGWVLGNSWIYRTGTRLAPFFMGLITRNHRISWLPWPLSRWTRVRPLPEFNSGFRTWWRKTK